MIKAKTKVILHDEARQHLIDGVNIVADAVKSTLGPGGRNVCIEKDWGAPAVTKDGVTVAKSISLSGPEKEGAKLVTEVANKSVDLSGDGTTTSAVLTQALLNEGFKVIEKGRNAIEVKRGIDMAVKKVVEHLTKMAKPIENNEEIKQVALVSANGDEEVANTVLQAIETVGRDGVITVEESKTSETYLEHIDGMELDKGYKSSYFITNAGSQTFEAEQCRILATQDMIRSMQQILPILEQCARDGRGLLIIGKVEQSVLDTLILNKLQGAVKVCVIDAPSYGEKQVKFMNDVAIMTGATLIAIDQGKSSDSITIDDCGFAGKVTVGFNNTIIMKGAGDKAKIEERVKEIQLEIENDSSAYDKEKDKARLANLTTGIAVIKVGAPSETEAKEIKDRYDDAIGATKAAIEEGILPGGGVAYIRAKAVLDKTIETSDFSADAKAGMKIVSDALTTPLRTLADNAGKPADVVIDKVSTNTLANFGYDIRKDEYYDDMVEKGIIDPLKVTRYALINASSIAGLILSSECLIVKEDEKPQNQPIA